MSDVCCDYRRAKFRRFTSVVQTVSQSFKYQIQIGKPASNPNTNKIIPYDTSCTYYITYLHDTWFHITYTCPHCSPARAQGPHHPGGMEGGPAADAVRPDGRRGRRPPGRPGAARSGRRRHGRRGRPPVGAHRDHHGDAPAGRSQQRPPARRDQ